MSSIASIPRPCKPANRESIAAGGIALGFVLMFALLALRHAALSSATFDEVAHLPAGLSYLMWDDYRLNPEHPPFIKLWSALFASLQAPWLPDVEAPDPASGIGRESEEGLRRSWASGLDQYQSQWLFGYYYLFGPKSGALQRAGVAAPMQLPSTTVWGKDDFLNNTEDLLFFGRIAIVLLGLLLAVLVFSWARELWGLPGGILSLALFCFDPNFIAHSSLITTDLGATLFMFGAIYFLWRTGRRIVPLNVILTVAFFSLALASKFSSILLLPVFALLFMIRVFSDPWAVGEGGRRLVTLKSKGAAAAGLFLAAGLTAWLVIWALYGFRYSAQKNPVQAALQEVRYSTAIQADQSPAPGTMPVGYVVRRTAAINALMKKNPEEPQESEITAMMPVVPVGLAGRLILFAQKEKLMPEAYLYGLASARMRSQIRGSFLRGEYSIRGFWSYFPWTFAIKTPLPTLAAILGGLFFAIRRREPWRIRLLWLLVPVVVYAGISIASRLNIGVRHLLPVYPMLFVLAGQLAREWSGLGSRIKPAVALLSLTAIAISGSFVFCPPWRLVPVYPHYLAYFNEIAGGPEHGSENLVDSNLDWGQGLKALKSWQDLHPLEKPVFYSCFGMADPRYYGIRHVNVPKVLGGYVMEPSPYELYESRGLFKEAIDQFARDLREGDLIAISATTRNGVYDAFPMAGEFWRNTLKRSVLIDRIGYSIFIYKVGARLE